MDADEYWQPFTKQLQLMKDTFMEGALDST